MISTHLGTLLPLLEPSLQVTAASARAAVTLAATGVVAHPAAAPQLAASSGHVHADPLAVPVLAANSLSAIISRARLWIMAILGSIATLFLVLGGVRYLTAGGDPGEVERAKSALKSALIGYALALIAPLLLTVLESITGEHP
ncbi:pilin [Actinocatenispora rupis]|uniref:TrbC/VIRB2 family protein n=1 Tax=Actinocatenispora rupis TaxID=519421 RepID=A0A8J3IX13_9ACTN|nr:pilin [Actinocatenispora rupis]GID10230.1 hypothetical protein Aru02nite_11190 [Actinocatenispora rupis]